MAWQAVLCVTGVLLGAPVMAMADSVQFHIAAQPLALALKAFAEQANMQLLYQYDVVNRLNGKSVSGDLEKHTALHKLLEGTGLEAIYFGDSDATIRPIRSVPKSSASDVEKNGDNDVSPRSRLQLAQEAQGASTEPSTVGKGNSESASQVKSAQLEEVVVTAQKREERLIDVPISIVAVGSEELERRRVVSLDELGAFVPGLAVQNAGQVHTITLRGVSNIAGNASLIGMYVDEADVTSESFSQLDLDTYDLQRVEVLRGPQGTLYGDGSIGGTIRLITNIPVLNQFQMRSDVSALFTQDGAPSQRIQAVVNVPLVDNVFGIRVAGLFDHQGGWMNQPAASATHINEQNIVDVRAKALWQPTSQFSVSAMTEIHRNDEVPSTGEDLNGNYTQVFNLTTTPRVTDHFDIYNLTLAYDFRLAKLLNSTSYLSQNNATYNAGTVDQFAPPPVPAFNYYVPYYSKKANTLTDELRLSSSDNGPWQWTVGGFFRRLQFNYDAPVQYFGLAGPPGTPLPPPFPAYLNTGSSRAHSFFGDLSYTVLGRLTLGAGVRNYRDEESYTLGPTQTQTFRSTDPRYYANLKITDHLNTYASASKGFRSGGFNAQNQPTFAPENVWTYEFGVKTSQLDSRLNADLSIFYSKYRGYVVSGTAPRPALPIAIYQNAGNAVIKGVEWDVTWRFADGWSFSANGDYLKTYFTDIALIPSTASYAVGDPLDGVPKYQDSFSLERDFLLGDKPVFARLDYNLQGRETFRNRVLGPFYFSQSDVLHTLNFNTGVQWNDNLSLGLFALNLLNDRGYTSPNLLEQLASRARPRTYGVNFGVKF